MLPMAIMELMKLAAKVLKLVLALTNPEVDPSDCNSASDVRSPKPTCKFLKYAASNFVGVVTSRFVVLLLPDGHNVSND
jgi:hypothetical protein